MNKLNFLNIFMKKNLVAEWTTFKGVEENVSATGLITKKPWKFVHTTGYESVLELHFTIHNTFPLRHYSFN